MEGAYVDAKREDEQQPNDDDRCKSASNLRRAQGLNQEEADQDGARCADDGGRGDIGLDDLQAVSFDYSPTHSEPNRDQKGHLPLNGTQHRLGWREDPICDAVNPIRPANVFQTYRT